MYIRLGKFQLQTDPEKTRKFYKKMKYVTDGCGCAGCRNFEKAVDYMPDEVFCFFHSLGIDMKKITEIYVNRANPDGTLLYGGFCHLCGTMPEGKSAWVETQETSDSKTFVWQKANTYEISDDFRVSFQEECALVEKGFPRPVLQMEIEAAIPWVLEEENPYL